MPNEEPQTTDTPSVTTQSTASVTPDVPVVVTPEPTSTPEQTPMPTFTPTPVSTQAPALTLAPVVTPEPTEAPVVTPAPVVLSAQQATSTTLESMIEEIKRADNSAAKFAIAGIESYIANMRPGTPIQKNEIVMHQTGLWHTLHNMLENTEDDFNKVYSVVLGLFHKHKDGVFNEHYIFRMMSDVTLDEEEIRAFQSLINLVKVTADPIGRQQALKQNVDISRTLANVFTENARQKILAFYGM